MNPHLKRNLSIVLLLTTLVVTAGLAWKWGDIKRLLAVNSLFAEQNIVRNFSHMDRMFFNKPMPLPTQAPTPLPPAPRDMPGGLDDWIAARSVTGLVVLKNGHIAFEGYYKGTGQDDLRISWSVAKSYLSALFGVLLEEGAIDSLDDPVVKYAPELAGSAYDGASIRNVLNMASGVTFNEDYLDFNSDINKMGRVLALGGSMDKFAAGLTGLDAPAGTAWQYVSIDTHVIGMVIRGATGRDIPGLMAEKILAPLRLEASPYYLTDGKGVAFVLGGLNLRTRDYARFGQMFLNHGALDGRRIVPESWVLASTRASAPTAPGEVKYGFQWWLPADPAEGEYFARGIYGQYIYVNEPQGVVIAVNSADRGFREDGSFEQNLDMFRQIVAGL